MREAEMFIRADRAFTGAVNNVTTDQWHHKVPATPDWTVRELVNHVAHTSADFIASLGGDAPAGEDLLGDNPAQSWARIAQTAEDLAEACTDESKATGIAVQTVDRTIHSWDLQGAIGADQTMDPKLAEFAYETMLPNAETLAASGMFGVQVPVPEDADVSAKLLGLAGRDPGVSGGDIHMTTSNYRST